MPEGLLSELTILDLTEGAGGPFCTKLFADYGARVVKVERPGRGDPARRVGPFPSPTSGAGGGPPTPCPLGPGPGQASRGAGPAAGALFLSPNTGKQNTPLEGSKGSG